MGYFHFEESITKAISEAILLLQIEYDFHFDMYRNKFKFVQHESNYFISEVVLTSP